jgi:hypothetical protein
LENARGRTPGLASRPGEATAEFRAREQFLARLPGCLKPGARVAILTFHSGEDRCVKKALHAGHRDGIYARIAADPIRPSPEERRAKPALLQHETALGGQEDRAGLFPPRYLDCWNAPPTALHSDPKKLDHPSIKSASYALIGVRYRFARRYG